MDYLKMLENFDFAKIGCDFADIRIEERNVSSIKMENHSVANGIQENNLSAFIRIYNEGRWFYKSISDISTAEEKAVLLSKTAKTFSGKSKEFYKLSKPQKTILKKYSENNTLSVPLSEKKDLLFFYDSLTKNTPECKITQSSYIDRYSRVYYKNSQGVQSEYDFSGCQIGVSYILSDGTEQFADNHRVYGVNINDLLKKEKEFSQSIEESRLFLKAPNITPGVYPLILSPMTTGVFAHESFGHKSESDFMLGDENMKKEWEIGKKVGSSILSIIDDGNLEDVSGYCPIDDEGTPAEKTYLIKNGILTGRLHSLSTAEELGEKPTGNARAINTEFEPIVRMTNTYVDKGDSSFEELVSGIDNGFYIKSLKHGSGLSTFTIAPLRAYSIKSGKIGEPVKISVITGNVFETLGDIDGLSKEITLVSSLMGGCGKMEQYPLRVSFGGPFMRVSKMNAS